MHFEMMDRVPIRDDTRADTSSLARVRPGLDVQAHPGRMVSPSGTAVRRPPEESKATGTALTVLITGRILLPIEIRLKVLCPV